jgi:hypothetical protein
MLTYADIRRAATCACAKKGGATYADVCHFFFCHAQVAARQREREARELQRAEEQEFRRACNAIEVLLCNYRMRVARTQMRQRMRIRMLTYADVC